MKITLVLPHGMRWIKKTSRQLGGIVQMHLSTLKRTTACKYKESNIRPCIEGWANLNVRAFDVDQMQSSI